MTAMIPINNVALGMLPPERVKNASGLFNLTRNLRGAIGLAALTTILNDRTDLHLARLHERLTFASKPALETWMRSPSNCRHGSETHTQGLVMAFADVFFLLTLLFVALAALAVIIKRPPGLGAA
jgi:DHA2 family multidrug resistance protein